MFSSSQYSRFYGPDPRVPRQGRGHSYRSSAPITPRSPSPPFGPVLSTASLGDLISAGTFSGDAKISNVEDVASYNWIRADKPRIMVPGKPPKWTTIKNPTRLKEDGPKGVYYRDINAACFPSYPMEPVVRSVFEVRPDFKSQEVDVFGCGGTMGNLLRFVQGRESEKPFRFLVEAVGKTVFLIRRENSPKETMQGVRGYGHSFPEANSQWDADVRGSLTNQRIIRYQLGDLDTVVRFEADGYLGAKHDATKTSSASKKNPVDDGDLAAALTGSSITTHIPDRSDTLEITRGQDHVPQSAIYDLKTRSIKTKHSKDVMAAQIPRLWIRQIPIFILAYHDSGLFRTEETTVRNIEADVANWVRDHERHVRNLIIVIKYIAEVVKATPEKKLEVRYLDERLELRKQAKGVNSVLPGDLVDRWTNSYGDEKSHDKVAGRVSKVALTEERNGKKLSPRIDQVNIDAEVDVDDFDWERKPDYTACSSQACNYCGRCSY